MTSKYGLQLYGKDLYSAAYGLLTADLSFSVVPVGHVSISKPFHSNLTVTVDLFGRIVEEEFLVSDLPLIVSLQGTLFARKGMRGDLDIPVDLAGDLRRTRSVMFTAELPFTVTIQGRLGYQTLFEGVPLEFYVLISGGANIYIGPFWSPDVPVEDSWVPDVPEDGFWVPDVPVSGNWSP